MKQRPKKLLERVHDVIRLKYYSYKTENNYVNWIKRYILFHYRHPLIDGEQRARGIFDVFSN